MVTVSASATEAVVLAAATETVFLPSPSSRVWSLPGAAAPHFPRSRCLPPGFPGAYPPAGPAGPGGPRGPDGDRDEAKKTA
ncbi:hypothetical protein Ct61P_10245 [Colletotrichum tofieldiae]|nr:hypothetical protein Ct61P_10245 [Colletotrichum tofieldiae]